MSGRAKVQAVVVALLALALFAAGATGADRSDPSFGSGGVAVVQAPAEAQGRNVGVVDLSVANGGSMVAAVGGLEGARYFALARLGPTGALDAAFATQGFTPRLRVHHSGPAGDALQLQAQGLALAPGGRIVAAGYQENSVGGTAPLLARFRADGVLDRGFGRAGVVAPVPASEATSEAHPIEGGGQLHDLALAPGGRIVAVGAQNEDRGARPAAMVIAYRPDGRIDRSFAHRGRLLITGVSRYRESSLTAVTVLPNRRILVAGYLRGRLALLRLTPDGELDRGFGGGDGKTFPAVAPPGFCCQPRALLTVQRDGRILVGGEAARRGEYPLALARFLPDGRPDRSFGMAGVASGGRSSSYVVPSAIALQGDGRIVVGGFGERVGSDRKVYRVFTGVRYLPNGKLDRAFGHGGIQVLHRDGGASAAAAVTGPSGQVVVAGGVTSRSSSPATPALLLTRYLSGGGPG